MVIQGPYSLATGQFSIPLVTPPPAQVLQALVGEQRAALVDALMSGGAPLPAGCFGPAPSLPLLPPGFDATSAAALVQALRGASPFGPAALGAGLPGLPPGIGGAGGAPPYLTDLRALLGQPASGAMSTRDASQVLLQNFEQCSQGGKFGPSITKSSLEKVVASDTASPELKAAANTFLNNPQALEVIGKAHKDGPTGGVTRGDLNTVLSPGNSTLGGLDALNPANLVPGSEQHALATLRKHWDQVGTGKFGTASRGDLQRILGSDSAPPELKQAVAQVLGTPGLFDRLQGAQRDVPFGISKADVNTALAGG